MEDPGSSPGWISVSFPYAVVTEPPYTISANGWGEFMTQIVLHFHNNEKAKIKHYLTLPYRDESSVDVSESVHFCFENPSEDFKGKLLQAGGMFVPTGKDSRQGRKSIFPRKWAATVGKKIPKEEKETEKQKA